MFKIHSFRHKVKHYAFQHFKKESIKSSQFSLLRHVTNRRSQCYKRIRSKTPFIVFNKMFYNTGKSKTLQRSSELGLYRYHDCDNDLHTTNTNRKAFRYFIVLLTAIIVVSLVSVKFIYSVNNIL